MRVVRVDEEFRPRSQTVLGIKPGACLRGDSVTVNAKCRGRSGNVTPQGDQARFERVREFIGAESVRERDGRGIELPLALATLPHYASPDGGPMGAGYPAAAGPARDQRRGGLRGPRHLHLRLRVAASNSMEQMVRRRAAERIQVVPHHHVEIHPIDALWDINK